MTDFSRLANHLYEAGHLKRMVRTGQRNYLQPDFTDSVASHSFRVAVIAYHLATFFDKADPNKAATMGLFHDLPEARTGDVDWVAKKYVQSDDGLAIDEQSKGLDDRYKQILIEFEEKDSIESKIVKDADALELILTLRELEHKGNKEATKWLGGIDFGREPDKYNQLRYVSTEKGKELGKAIYDTDPSDWWHMIAANKSL